MRKKSGCVPVQRILLKISGESFGSKEPFEMLHVDHIIHDIVDAYNQGVEMGIVMGGGNIVRGAVLEKKGIPRTTGDEMGMLATVINALILRDLLRLKGIKAAIINARLIEGIGEAYQRDKCLDYLASKTILLFAGGTGHPYFTTDTAAALRAVELEAQCLLKGTKVDGVYENYSPDLARARKLDILTYEKAIRARYQVMDLTAIAFCMENRMPIRVFNLMQPGNLLRAICGEIGTWIGV
jgi:uridylate kinase